jgi:DNA-binding MarR family transcriptional regulator
MSDNAPKPPDALMERLSFLLKRTSGLVEQAIGTELARLSINGREFGVLTLIDAEGPASQQRLANRIGVDRTTMVALIDALEEKRLVHRRRDPSDRRAYQLEATSRGRETLRDALEAVELGEQQALASLSNTESAAFKQALQRLAQHQPAGT